MTANKCGFDVCGLWFLVPRHQFGVWRRAFSKLTRLRNLNCQSNIDLLTVNS